MSTTMIESREKLESMLSYLNLRKPTSTLIYTPQNTVRYLLVITLKTPEGTKIHKDFLGPDNEDYQQSLEITHRHAMIYLRDYYTENSSFQKFIYENIYFTDPFILEYNNHKTIFENHDLTLKLKILSTQHDALHQKLRQFEEHQNHLGMLQAQSYDEAYKTLSEEVQKLRTANIILSRERDTYKEAINDALDILLKTKNKIMSNNEDSE